MYIGRPLAADMRLIYMVLLSSRDGLACADQTRHTTAGIALCTGEYPQGVRCHQMSGNLLVFRYAMTSDVLEAALGQPKVQ